jgi:osmoprotectant transport system ATP-binding protein
MIDFRQVSKSYGAGPPAVDALSLEVRSREITVLLGPSGCGKTTALRMVNRLVEPTSGAVELDGRDVRSLPVHELRRGIGYVIQQAGLFPHRTVADNIATVPRLLRWDRARRRARALELVELVGLSPAIADRYPAQLSGGQQQRVGVARALAADPPVPLMDEPFGAVDPVRRRVLQQEFRRLQRELGKTVLLVTHDVDEAVVLADRIAVMREGAHVVQYDAPEVLLARPSDADVAAFVGATRGLKLLSLRSATDVPATAVGPEGIAGWHVRTDAAGRPATWAHRTGELPEPAVETVGPDGSMRDLLDSALASPARAAVRVDAAGALVGTVPFSVLAAFLSETETPLAVEPVP